MLLQLWNFFQGHWIWYENQNVKLHGVWIGLLILKPLRKGQHEPFFHSSQKCIYFIKFSQALKMHQTHGKQFVLYILFKKHLTVKVKSHLFNNSGLSLEVLGGKLMVNFINFIGSHVPRHVSHSMSHVTTKQCCNHFGGYSKHTV